MPEDLNKPQSGTPDSASQNKNPEGQRPEGSEAEDQESEYEGLSREDAIAQLAEAKSSNRKLARENASRRKKEQEAEQEARDKAEATLKEKGEFEKLYSQSQSDLAKLQGDYAALQRQHDSLRACVTTGISFEDWGERLKGKDYDELLVDAQAIAKKFSSNPPPSGTPRNVNQDGLNAKNGRPPQSEIVAESQRRMTNRQSF